MDISPRSAQFLGLNLTEADHVVLLDPWWNPAGDQIGGSSRLTADDIRGLLDD